MKKLSALCVDEASNLWRECNRLRETRSAGEKKPLKRRERERDRSVRNKFRIWNRGRRGSPRLTRAELRQKRAT